jgi:predicted DsbA family dithiol-disulfide isomerase
MPLRVEMWGDIQCVWCYIELALLRNAVVELGGGEIRFRTYSLTSPVTARPDTDTRDGWLERHHAGIATVAAEAGLDYDHKSLRSTDSQGAHEVVHFAAAHGKPGQMVDRLYMAHFAEGLDIGDPECLADLAAECGLDRDGVITALAQRSYSAAVEQDNHLAYLLGATAMPFVVINGRYTLTGAQTPRAVKHALTLVRNAREARL